jgi:hypothetical protein
MASEFVVLIDGQLKTYENYADIPETFDNLIKFLPEVPPPPHTEEQHEEMETWNEKLLILMERESASRNKNR